MQRESAHVWDVVDEEPGVDTQVLERCFSRDADGYQECREKVLIAEDEAIVADVIQRSLSREGYQTCVAEDGQKALEVTQSENPDIILLDLMMPKMNGYVVIQLLRSRPETRHIPIIVMTGHGEGEVMERVMNMGANEYLRKPFTPRVLVSLVGKYAQA